MKTVHKFEINPGINYLFIPFQSEFLSVKVQKGNPVIYVLLDTEKAKFERIIEVYGTGHEMKKNINRRFIDTFMLENDSLVFHVFEVIE